MPHVKPEFWAWANGADPARRAQISEAQGWDGIGLGDSQNLQLDVYVALATAAAATTTLQLATAVTNPLTRHAAVTAGAAATLQQTSGGRFTLGIGRGDSAVTHLGMGPVKVTEFGRYVGKVQGYLRGEDVPFDVEEYGKAGAESAGLLGLAARPTASRIRWIDHELPKVPVDFAASGPKMIALAAELAERVTFTVGVDADRLRWAIGVAHSACAERGREKDSLGLGVYVPILVHPDPIVARDAIGGMAASTARFSVMEGRVAVPTNEREAEALQHVHDSYDFGQHFTRGSPQSAHMDDQMVDSWTIAGPPGYCIERLQEVIELGISKIFVLDGGWGIDAEISRGSRRMLREEVFPHLK